MQRTIRRSIVAGTACIVSALALVGVSDTGGAAPTSNENYRVADGPAEPEPTSPAALGAYVSDAYPNAWGGANVTAGAATIYVVRDHVQTVRSAVARFAADSHNTSTYEIVPVDNSYDDLVSLTDRIAVENDKLRPEIYMTEFGPDPEKNRVTISLRKYSLESADALYSMYGRDGIYVVPESDQETAVRAAGRFDDTRPWYGGDNLFFQAQSPDTICTGGFSMRTGLETYLTATAGHCWPTAGDISVWTTLTENRYYGLFQARDFEDGGLDTAKIKVAGTSAPYVWSGFQGNEVSGVNGWYKSSQHLGELIAFSGATTGEKVHATLEAANICRVIGGVETCHLGRAHKDGDRICWEGDSGGPVYQRHGDVVWAMGTIVGFNAVQGTTCWYQTMYYVLNRWNARLLVL